MASLSNFFKQFWNTVKMDLFHLCADFYDGRANLERINWANIVLIPKVASPEGPGDFRPISLINSTLKILSKLLASRLSKVMNSLVDAEQSAFLKEDFLGTSLKWTLRKLLIMLTGTS